jgi:hypothetical protein
MGLGPIGALVWGAFKVGQVAERGLSVRVRVELAPEDRALLDRAVNAHEAIPHAVASRPPVPVVIHLPDPVAP